MSTALLEKIAGEERAAVETAQAKLDTFAKKMAEGIDPPETELRKALQIVDDKLATKFTAKVELAKTRNGSREAIARGVAASAEYKQITTNLANASAVFEAAVAAARLEYTNVAGPLQARQAECVELSTKVDTTRNHLIATCPDKALVARADSNRRDISRLSQESQEAHSRLDDAKLRLSYAVDKKRPGGASEWLRVGDDRGGDPQQVRNLQASIERHETTVAEVDRKLGEARRLEVELRQLMIEA